MLRPHFTQSTYERGQHTSPSLSYPSRFMSSPCPRDHATASSAIAAHVVCLSAATMRARRALATPT